MFVTTLNSGRSLIAGGMTLAILVLPIVVITTAEALSVPCRLRSGKDLRCRCPRSEVITSHVLPYAMPGILTGVPTLARAFGETAPLIMVGAITGVVPNGRGRGRHGSAFRPVHGAADDRVRLVQPQEEFRALTAAAIIALLAVILAVNAAAIVAQPIR